jgi:glucose-6-phosphate isomerase
MTAQTLPLKRRAAWKKLQGHFKVIGHRHLRELFAEDVNRGEQLSLEAAGIYLDYSKNRITRTTLELLVELAEESGLRERIDAMFAGEPINVSENRSVLHVALRAPGGASIWAGGQDVVPEVHDVLARMSAFAAKVRSGAWLGYTGRPITNVLNIGIGGSDLGPAMSYEALKAYSNRDMTFRFVSNVDGTDFVEAVRDLDPSQTMFIVSSKTFTTLETMTNATAARRGSAIASWLLDLTAAALASDSELKRFAGRVSDSGEGRWTIKAAVDTAVPTPVLTASVYERFSSRGNAEFQGKGAGRTFR